MSFFNGTRKHTLSYKIITILIIQAFFLSNLALAVPKKEEGPGLPEKEVITSPDKVVIPRDFGLVKTRFQGKEEKLIVHIQDAHCNYEAQSNIVKILENLIRNYNLSFISVEGAEGMIDTTWFKSFPDEDVRREVATYFMKKGEITGPEFLSITTDYPIKLFGAETKSYYIKNLNAFTTSYPLKEATESYFNEIKTALNRLKTYIYTEELKEMDQKTQDYEHKKIAFNDYVRYLQAMSEKKKVNLREYDNFFKLVNTLIYEKKIDFSIVDKERNTLIDELTKKLTKDEISELVMKSLTFKVGKISAAEYYKYLRALANKNRMNMTKRFPNLSNYVIYISVYSRIENEKLFKEIDVVRKAIKKKMFRNEDQRTLDKLSHHVDTLLGLVNIKLLNDDFDYYENHRDEFEAEVFIDFIEKQGKRYGLAYKINLPTEEVTESLPKLEDFYRIALKRDRAIVDNTIKEMKNQKVQIAVLVSGGFHTEGITQLLEDKGVSYLVVSPSITKDVPTRYIEVLTNQKTPFEELLIGVAEASEGLVAAILEGYLMSLTPAQRQALYEELDSDVRGRFEHFVRGYRQGCVAVWLRRRLRLTPPSDILGRDVDAWVDEYVAATYVAATDRARSRLSRDELDQRRTIARDTFRPAIAAARRRARTAVSVPAPRPAVMRAAASSRGVLVEDMRRAALDKILVEGLKDKKIKEIKVKEEGLRVYAGLEEAIYNAIPLTLPLEQGILSEYQYAKLSVAERRAIADGRITDTIRARLIDIEVARQRELAEDATRVTARDLHRGFLPRLVVNPRIAEEAARLPVYLYDRTDIPSTPPTPGEPTAGRPAPPVITEFYFPAPEPLLPGRKQLQFGRPQYEGRAIQVIHVSEGKGILYFVKYEGETPVRAYQRHVEEGELVVAPPGWAVQPINLGKLRLEMVPIVAPELADLFGAEAAPAELVLPHVFYMDRGRYMYAPRVEFGEMAVPRLPGFGAPVLPPELRGESLREILTSRPDLILEFVSRESLFQLARQYGEAPPIDVVGPITRLSVIAGPRRTEEAKVPTALRAPTTPELPRTLQAPRTPGPTRTLEAPAHRAPGAPTTPGLPRILEEQVPAILGAPESQREPEEPMVLGEGEEVEVISYRGGLTVRHPEEGPQVLAEAAENKVPRIHIRGRLYEELTQPQREELARYVRLLIQARTQPTRPLPPELPKLARRVRGTLAAAEARARPAPPAMLAAPLPEVTGTITPAQIAAAREMLEGRPVARREVTIVEGEEVVVREYENLEASITAYNARNPQAPIPLSVTLNPLMPQELEEGKPVIRISQAARAVLTPAELAILARHALLRAGQIPARPGEIEAPEGRVIQIARAVEQRLAGQAQVPGAPETPAVAGPPAVAEMAAVLREARPATQREMAAAVWVESPTQPVRLPKEGIGGVDVEVAEGITVPLGEMLQEYGPQLLGEGVKREIPPVSALGEVTMEVSLGEELEGMAWPGYRIVEVEEGEVIVGIRGKAPTIRAEAGERFFIPETAGVFYVKGTLGRNIVTVRYPQGIGVIQEKALSSVEIPAYPVETLVTGPVPIELPGPIAAARTSARGTEERLSLEELQPEVREEARQFLETAREPFTEAQHKKGIVIVAGDSNLCGRTGEDASVEDILRWEWIGKANLESAIQRAMGENEDIIFIRGRGANLVTRVKQQLAACQRRGIAVRKVVTVAHKATAEDIYVDPETGRRLSITDALTEELRTPEESLLLSINTSELDTKENIHRSYLPIMRLYRLALMFAHDYVTYDRVSNRLVYTKEREFKDCLRQIVRAEVADDEILEWLKNRIIKLLPKITPIEFEKARDAYKAAKQALIAL